MLFRKKRCSSVVLLVSFSSKLLIWFLMFRACLCAFFIISPLLCSWMEIPKTLSISQKSLCIGAREGKIDKSLPASTRGGSS